jgi:PAS domain S-box-containing protein
MMIENIQDGVFIIENGEITSFNERICEITGFTKEELAHLNAIDIAIPEERVRLRQIYQEFKKGKISSKLVKFWIQRKDGALRYIQCRFSFFYQDDKTNIWFIGTSDITEQKLAEDLLRKNEKEKSIILNGLSDLVLYFNNPEMRITWANKAAAESIGSSVDQLTGRYCYEIWPQRDKICNRCPVSKAFKTGQPEKNEAITPDGRTWLIKSYPVKDELGKVIGVVEVTVNTTEIRKFEKELHESEERYRSIVENSHDGVVILDDNYRFVYANNEFYKISGRSHEDIIDQDFRTLINGEINRETEKIAVDYYDRKQNGEKIPKELEFSIFRKNGKKRWVVSRSTMFNDSKGRKRILSQVLDITDRKLAEEREDILHSLLRHDLTNKNLTALGYLQLVEEFELPKECKEIVDRVITSIKESQFLLEKIDMLREVNREDESIKVNLDSFLILAIEKNLFSAHKYGIDLVRKTIPIDVLGGPLLEELFHNLIENAIKHANCSKIVISSHEQDGIVVISIEDDGKGIPKEMRNKLFHRGYKRKGSKGLGLGTYLIKKIAENYGGNIYVNDSALGGVKFDIIMKKAS